MKAIVITKYGASDVLQYKDVAKPQPKDNEVLIKVHAASVNDWDLGLMSGKPFINRILFGLFKPKIKIPGADVAGRVIAVGKDIKKIRAGDNVFGDLSECHFGSFAEFVCAQEKSLSKKPTAMTFIEAAALPHSGMLAIQGLHDIGQLQKGQKVLINGAGGGVGTLGVQIAKSIGVEITGVDNAGKLEMMRSIGFNHVIDYTQEDFTKNGKFYDLILDTKTNRSAFSYARSLNQGGRYVTVGGSILRIISALAQAPFISMLNKKKIFVLGLKPNKDLDFLKELFEAGKLKPIIDGPYRLTEVPKAIQYFKNGAHKGKIIINIEHDAANSN